MVVQANLYFQQGASFLVQGFENLVFPGIQECSTRIDGSEGRFPVFYRYFPDDRDDIRQLVELPEQEMAARRLRQCEQGAGMNAIQVIEILGFIVEHQQVVLPVGVFQADELVER